MHLFTCMYKCVLIYSFLCKTNMVASSRSIMQDKPNLIDNDVCFFIENLTYN